MRQTIQDENQCSASMTINKCRKQVPDKFKTQKANQEIYYCLRLIVHSQEESISL